MTNILNDALSAINSKAAYDPTILTKANYNGDTALHLAISKGDLVNANKLLDAGDKEGVLSKMLSTKDGDGNTPIVFASLLRGKEAIVVAIFKKLFASSIPLADVLEIYNDELTTAILMIVNKNKHELFTTLLDSAEQAGKVDEFLNVKESTSKTAYHLAAIKGHKIIVKAILDKVLSGKAKKDHLLAKDELETTGYSWAAEKKHIDLISDIDAAAKQVSGLYESMQKSQDNEGNTALMNSLLKKDNAIVTKAILAGLIKHASLSEVLVLSNNDGSTPLSALLTKKHTATYQYMLEQAETAKSLPQLLSLKVKDNKGAQKSQEEVACPETAELIRKFRAKVNVTHANDLGEQNSNQAGLAFTVLANLDITRLTAAHALQLQGFNKKGPTQEQLDGLQELLQTQGVTFEKILNYVHKLPGYEKWSPPVVGKKVAPMKAAAQGLLDEIADKRAKISTELDKVNFKINTANLGAGLVLFSDLMHGVANAAQPYYPALKQTMHDVADGAGVVGGGIISFASGNPLPVAQQLVSTDRVRKSLDGYAKTTGYRVISYIDDILNLAITLGGVAYFATRVNHEGRPVGLPPSSLFVVTASLAAFGSNVAVKEGYMSNGHAVPISFVTDVAIIGNIPFGVPGKVASTVTAGVHLYNQIDSSAADSIRSTVGQVTESLATQVTDKWHTFTAGLTKHYQAATVSITLAGSFFSISRMAAPLSLKAAALALFDASIVAGSFTAGFLIYNNAGIVRDALAGSAQPVSTSSYVLQLFNLFNKYSIGTVGLTVSAVALGVPFELKLQSLVYVPAIITLVSASEHLADYTISGVPLPNTVNTAIILGTLAVITGMVADIALSAAGVVAGIGTGPALFTIGVVAATCAIVGAGLEQYNTDLIKDRNENLDYSSSYPELTKLHLKLGSKVPDLKASFKELEGLPDPSIRKHYNTMITTYCKEYFMPEAYKAHLCNWDIGPLAEEASTIRNAVKGVHFGATSAFGKLAITLLHTQPDLSGKTAEDTLNSACSTGGQDVGLDNNGFGEIIKLSKEMRKVYPTAYPEKLTEDTLECAKKLGYLQGKNKGYDIQNIYNKCKDTFFHYDYECPETDPNLININLTISNNSTNYNNSNTTLDDYSWTETLYNTVDKNMLFVSLTLIGAYSAIKLWEGLPALDVML